MIDFIDGPPPNKQGHYWLRLTNTDTHPVPGNHEVGTYAWKCSCHSDELMDLKVRHRRNIELGFQKITGYVILPDPKSQ